MTDVVSLRQDSLRQDSGETHLGKTHLGIVWHIVRPASSARALKAGAKLSGLNIGFIWSHKYNILIINYLLNNLDNKLSAELSM